MIRKLLKNQYGIKIEEEIRIGNYDACRNQDQLYILVPVINKDVEELSELEQLANHLVQSGDHRISTFLRTKDGKPYTDWETERYCVLVSANMEQRKVNQYGRKLAKLHARGRTVTFPVKKISRIGQWKQLWEIRLDQMEKAWNEMLFGQPDHDFDRMFLESFPYYMGLAENAIQYLVDSELDDEPAIIDSGTVCHNRFTTQTWKDEYIMKNPFDWVFDHSSRDMAEWTRDRYFHNMKTYEPELRQFIREYQSVVPLSSFSWRLYFARILFPLHYFDCIESFYTTTSEQQRKISEEQLQRFLQRTVDHERFLGNFFEFAEVPVHKWKIQIPEWLAK